MASAHMACQEHRQVPAVFYYAPVPSEGRGRGGRLGANQNPTHFWVPQVALLQVVLLHLSQAGFRQSDIVFLFDQFALTIAFAQFASEEIETWDDRTPAVEMARPPEL
jgi:hypothetical protein